MAKKILICDDDDLLREFYSRVVIAQGFETITAADGEEGLNMIRDNVADVGLVIMDLLMPIKTGWEVIDEMQQDEVLKEIPIIAISGLAASSEEFEKVKSACVEVLNKGEFELASFIAMIKEYVLE